MSSVIHGHKLKHKHAHTQKLIIDEHNHSFIIITARLDPHYKQIFRCAGRGPTDCFHFFLLISFQGLGRRMLPDCSQHYSNNLITWNTAGETRSCYTSSFRGQQGDERCRYRRFPRSHPQGKPGSAPVSTSTTRWFQPPDVPHRTPLHVLAVSQEPFLPPNKWTYSYRPIWYWKQDVCDI